jgi:Transposase, Mutator family
VEEGYAKGERPPFPVGNHRNGTSPKTVLTEVGPIPLEVPRDRNGKFEPQIVPKHARRVEGFNEAIVSLYAKGPTTGDIRAHLAEIYGVEVSRDLVSKVTDAVADELADSTAVTRSGVAHWCHLSRMWGSDRPSGWLIRYVAEHADTCPHSAPQGRGRCDRPRMAASGRRRHRVRGDGRSRPRRGKPPSAACPITTAWRGHLVPVKCPSERQSTAR